MYLKSIQVHGFKSFANKIVLDFHNGITGIVGPNGSGKSNVSDAVRWVLGEQSAKQLRGASMQDVIFSGTESRKPLSYAYVAITMDNSDHTLDIDFEEVTVARRVYRSGESEYLLNGSVCRLKDVNELFYDTGIGKEGYSIIGQGQIEKILSGRPEERRELFDEAAGIVKFKRRKVTAQKKLEAERENLVRIHDILSELERQTGPLEKQSEKAKLYLKKREELKRNDINLFLLEDERMQAEMKEVVSNCEIADRQLKETNASFEKIKSEYEEIECAIEKAEAEIEASREEISQTGMEKGRLEGEINVLNEKIKAAEMSDEHYKSRTREIVSDKEEKARQKQAYEEEKAMLDKQLAHIMLRRQKAQKNLARLQEEIQRSNAGIENGKNELLKLLSQKASIQTKRQKYDTLVEQAAIRKAQLSKQLLKQKSEESDLDSLMENQRQILEETRENIARLKEEEAHLLAKAREWEQKLADTNRLLEKDTAEYHRIFSRLESLKNIAERYDGYGNSIRKVMEQKDKEDGLFGVVSDLIKVDKMYETAIETALGGNIQNIVTRDDETAKRMIAYLKKNRFGRATFLPLTSVKGRGGIKEPGVLKENGVIGLASTLVKHDAKYNGIIEYLLGRVVVIDTIDHAVSLASKYRHSLSIVTLEGESLRPGGSMTGGAFKNAGNLLGRNREIEDLTQKLAQLNEALKEQKGRREEILTAQALLADELGEKKEQLQKDYLRENTARLNAERTRQQKEASEGELKSLREKSADLVRQIQEMESEQALAWKEIEAAKQREDEIAKENLLYQSALDEQTKAEESAGRAYSQVQVEEANLRQKSEFAVSNIERVTMEIEKCGIQMQELLTEVSGLKEDAQKHRDEIAEIEKKILESDEKHQSLQLALKEKLRAKEEMSARQKDFFGKREEMSKQIADLDKEIFRLNSQKEKLEELGKHRTDYIWEEYELTPHGALELREEDVQDLGELKKQIARLKDEIKSLGDINVNAIEEYKEVSRRYEFLKGQHDDLMEAEAVLIGIIDELDAGMRKQFTEKFAEIQHEFDRAFKELFGGGKGSLELVEDEDILECGIRIIAQPPGKKLQNMILLSGGEKSLTAIALLFAIQNLKPSPFCLLDEIEAALDDSNVGRFAKYLHKLTRNTQFIVITHRRGTMASADRLYGITMQEKGISTLVSVDLIEHDLDQ